MTFRRIFGVALFMLAAFTSSAVTNTAASSSLAAVQAAVDLCNAGDTALIPAGTSTWSGTLTIDLPIVLRGSGTNVTKIVSTSGTKVSYEGPSTGQPRITQIYFDLGSFSGSDHTAVSIGVTHKAFRIDHCRFRGGSKVIWTLATEVWGVIDHCTFIDSDGEIYPWGGYFDDQGSGNWALPVSLGSTNRIVVEDCMFQRGAGVTSQANEILYGSGGARCTFRYNGVTNTGNGFALYAIDAHGKFQVDGPDIRGTHVYEIYGNIFSGDSFRYVNLRGGTMICFSNNFYGSAGSPFQLKNEGVSTYGSFDPQDEIINSHFWSNNVNGALVNDPIDIETGSEAVVVLNDNYFLRPMQSGDANYPYTPLSYPHPLVLAQDGGGDTPIISVSPIEVDIAMASTATSNVTITVENIGGGTLTGAATLSVTNPWTISGSGVNYSLAAGASTNFTLSYTSYLVYASATLNLTGGGDKAVPILGGFPKLYVLPIGDSLTRGGASTGTNFIAGGYRGTLYLLLTNAGMNVVFQGSQVGNPSTAIPYNAHEGYGGFEVGDLSGVWDEIALPIPEPDYIILFAYLNDFRHANDVTNVINRHDSFITKMLTTYTNSTVICTAMNPWDNLPSTNAAITAYFTPFIGTRVTNHQAAGRSVYLADLIQPDVDVDDVMADATHLQASGYNKMATNYFDWINTLEGNGADATPPTVTAFVIPTTYHALIVPITTFTATDNVGVTGYLLTESSSTPSASNPLWSGSPWTTFTFTSQGAKTLYAWAKDALDNISSSLNDGVTINTTTVSNINVNEFRAE